MEKDQKPSNSVAGTTIDSKTQNGLNMKKIAVHRRLINFNCDLKTLNISLTGIWGYPSRTIQFSFQKTNTEGPKKCIHTSMHKIPLFIIEVTYGRFQS
jgi:hypothetical protein